MWKIVVGFIIFAGITLFVMMKGGEIDMSGEKHGTETAAPAPAAILIGPEGGFSDAERARLVIRAAIQVVGQHHQLKMRAVGGPASAHCVAGRAGHAEQGHR